MAEHVPTVPELAAMGPEYAVETDWVNDGTEKSPKWRATRWRVMDKGHALMGAVMRRNAQEARARGEGDWVQPPSAGNRWWTEPHVAHRRIALTCFERHPADCHRGVLAELWSQRCERSVQHLEPNGCQRLLSA